MADITRRTFGSLAALFATGQLAHAAEPAGKTILTISGRITRPNNGDAAMFDRAMLESMGHTTFDTGTPWYDKAARFEGVRMASLMEAVGAVGDTVTAVALNDYTTDLPVSDFEKFGVLLALKRDGEYMPVRDKGPLFIVYPYDSRPELKAQRYYSRSAWQVAKLIVK